MPPEKPAPAASPAATAPSDAYVLYLGVAAGNPGPAGWGAVALRAGKRAELGGPLDPGPFGVAVLDFEQAQLGAFREGLKLLGKKADAPGLLVAGAMTIGALGSEPPGPGRQEQLITALARAELADANAARADGAKIAVRARTPADLAELDRALYLALRAAYGKDHEM